MSLQTNLHGRLRNTPLASSNGLMPLFEAVVNSIHSIEERGSSLREGAITVEILRNGQGVLELNAKTNQEIEGFSITDNGIGFNDENMKSFETLDSEHKVDKGCRGVGRLLWLKAFNNIEIKSVFKAEEGFICREFTFDAKQGVSDPIDTIFEIKNLSTCVNLLGFEKRFKEATSKTVNSISNDLLEHCLWYFVRDGGVPKIIIRDGEEIINLDTLFEQYMYSSASTEAINIKGQEFELTHIKLRASSLKNHSISYCAASRLVKEESITGKIPGLFGRIGDGNGQFTYSCYISSKFLDERVRAERTGFDLEEKIEGLFSKTEISLRDIRDEVLVSVKRHLSDYLVINVQAGKLRVDEFVSNKAPRYRPILNHIAEDELAVDPNISDKDLDIVLHKHLSEIESQLLHDGHTIMVPKKDEGEKEYQKRLHEYLKTAEDIKKSDLANYVSHRRVILDLLEAAIQRGDDGKYSREDLIHELIMPMRSDSNEVSLDSCNLWLLDERLAFHDYLASDKTLKSMPITKSNETKEPDLLALNICDNPILVSEGNKLPLASIVVVEIKRPMRNDAKAGEEKDPVEQALGYLNRIRKGKVKTSGGRPIPNSDDIPGYCYVICDITETIEARCQMLDLTITSDHMGYFGFHKQFKSYIEVISFDRLVNSAKERNRAFFDRLGLPTI